MKEIDALFEFIDFLDSNKQRFVSYLPTIDKLGELFQKQECLHPNENYKERLEHNEIKKEINNLFTPIKTAIHVPVLEKLKDLRILNEGDETCASIWNNNISAIENIKKKFTDEDVNEILIHKKKYLDFRTETNSDFLGLSFMFENLDEVLQILFGYFGEAKTSELTEKTDKSDIMNELEWGKPAKLGMNELLNLHLCNFIELASKNILIDFDIIKWLDHNCTSEKQAIAIHEEIDCYIRWLDESGKNEGILPHIMDLIEYRYPESFGIENESNERHEKVTPPDKNKLFSNTLLKALQKEGLIEDAATLKWLKPKVLLAYFVVGMCEKYKLKHGQNRKLKIFETAFNIAGLSATINGIKKTGTPPVDYKIIDRILKLPKNFFTDNFLITK
jgi:hypothetical protein